MQVVAFHSTPQKNPQTPGPHNPNLMATEADVPTDQTRDIASALRASLEAYTKLGTATEHGVYIEALETFRDVTAQDTPCAIELTTPAIHTCTNWLAANPDCGERASLRTLLWLTAHKGALLRHHLSPCTCRCRHYEVVCAVIETTLRVGGQPMALWAALELLELQRHHDVAQATLPEEQQAVVCAGVVRLLDTFGASVDGPSALATAEAWPGVAPRKWDHKDEVFMSQFLFNAMDSREAGSTIVWTCAAKAPTPAKRAIILALERASSKGLCPFFAAKTIVALALASPDATLRQDALPVVLSASNAHGKLLVSWKTVMDLIPFNPPKQSNLFTIMKHLPTLLSQDAKLPKAFFNWANLLACDGKTVAVFLHHASPLLDGVVNFTKKRPERCEEQQHLIGVQHRLHLANSFRETLKIEVLSAVFPGLYRYVSNRVLEAIEAVLQGADSFRDSPNRTTLLANIIPRMLRDLIKPGSGCDHCPIGPFTSRLLVAMEAAKASSS